jgi:hypothetical protein
MATGRFFFLNSYPSSPGSGLELKGGEMLRNPKETGSMALAM